jgi:plastocyanin
VRVPDLVGLDLQSAEQRIKNVGLTVKVKTAAKIDTLHLPATVIRQSPREFSMVNSGSSVQITMNPSAAVPSARLAAIVLEGDPSPPYLINKPFSLAAVVTGINKNNSYTFTWYANGKRIGRGRSFTHTFVKIGSHTIKVRMISSDPRENATLERQVKIEYPRDFTVDFTFSPKLQSGATYKVGDQVLFAEACKNIHNISEYRWYINGRYLESGSWASHSFSEKGRYDITLGIRKGSNFDELKRTRSLTVGEAGIGVLGRERNRFKARGGLDNLTVCSQYWVGGRAEWSPECKTVSRIGAVDGYALCTGDQADGWNTGYLVYLKKGSRKLRFEVYYFNFVKWKGYVNYSGSIPGSACTDPDSISVSCHANAVDVSWINADGGRCRTRIWKTRYAQYGHNFGVEQPVCDSVIDSGNLRRCEKFARRSVEQYKENLFRQCDLHGPEWHGDLAGHERWCLKVSRKEADNLLRYRDKMLNDCGKTWCGAYASQAVEQNEENLRKGCGFKGRRWQSDYANHYNWCLSVAKKTADAETRQRDRDLARCSRGGESFCRSYAAKAVEQNERNIKTGCGFCGQRWQSDYDNHYSWCLEHTQSDGNFEIKAREKLLAKCRGVSSSGSRTFYEPCYNGYRLDNCLTFSRECEKPAADRFCQEKGFAQATAWKLENVSPTYIIDDHTLCRGGYCAGFKYITCSGGQHQDSQDLVCKISKPSGISFIDAGQSVYFAGTVQGTAKNNLRYKWEFGQYGAEPAASSKQTPGRVTFKWCGNYKVTLTVSDDRGNSCQCSRQVLVYDRQDPREFCEGYAAVSIEQNEENIRNGCGFSGEFWHSDERKHQMWCQSVTPDKVRAELRDREEKLRHCRGAADGAQKPAPVPENKIPDHKKHSGDRPKPGGSGFDAPAGGAGSGFTALPPSGKQPGLMKTFTCVNKDNQEKGCCCFLGAHTYQFAAQYVVSVLVRFDSGRGLNCRSTVTIGVDRGRGWETVETVKANSSRNGSESAPIEVPVPVNSVISGVRISDGCACCIDFSEITLNPESSGRESSPDFHSVSGKKPHESPDQNDNFDKDDLQKWGENHDNKIHHDPGANGGGDWSGRPERNGLFDGEDNFGRHDRDNDTGYDGGSVW